MSIGPTLRRADREMASAEVETFLREAYCGRLATSDASGLPYICPMLFVWRDGEIWFHNTRHAGHLLTNVRQQPSVCFD